MDTLQNIKIVPTPIGLGNKLLSTIQQEPCKLNVLYQLGYAWDESELDISHPNMNISFISYEAFLSEDLEIILRDYPPDVIIYQNDFFMKKDPPINTELLFKNLNSFKGRIVPSLRVNKFIASKSYHKDPLSKFVHPGTKFIKVEELCDEDIDVHIILNKGEKYVFKLPYTSGSQGVFSGESDEIEEVCNEIYGVDEYININSEDYVVIQPKIKRFVEYKFFVYNNRIQYPIIKDSYDPSKPLSSDDKQKKEKK